MPKSQLQELRRCRTPALKSTEAYETNRREVARDALFPQPIFISIKQIGAALAHFKALSGFSDIIAIY
jgi:hypothetical protein